MSNLQRRVFDARNSVSIPLPGPRAARPEIRTERPVALMRKYEVTALLPNQTVVSKHVVAPASKVFEETASAFARGTLVSTPTGPVAIEDLLPGDLVETERGPEPITWIGSTVFVPSVTESGSSLTKLTRVTSEAFGLSKPANDVLLGPAARTVVTRDRLESLIGKASVLVPALDFSDGERVFEVTPPSSVQMYHFALPRHGVFHANGMSFESYHPGRNITSDLGPNLRALFLSMFPNIDSLQDFGDLTYPRTTCDVIDNLMTS